METQNRVTQHQSPAIPIFPSLSCGGSINDHRHQRGEPEVSRWSLPPDFLGDDRLLFHLAPESLPANMGVIQVWINSPK